MYGSDGSNACIRNGIHLFLKDNCRMVLKGGYKYDYIDLQSHCAFVPCIYSN